MKTMAEKGDGRAKKALHVLDHFDTAITTILICTNIVHIAAASVVTVNVTRIWGISAVTISTIITTLAVFFFGEMLPKSIARKYCDSISLSTAAILSFLMTLLRPISLLLSAIGNAAGEGAKLALRDRRRWELAGKLAREADFLELATMREFQDMFVDELLFPDRS